MSSAAPEKISLNDKVSAPGSAGKVNLGEKEAPVAAPGKLNSSEVKPSLAAPGKLKKEAVTSLAAPGQLNLHEAVAWGSRTSDCYDTLDLVGEGTYGQVFKAREKGTGDVVALKKIRMDNEKEGFPITAIREIKILKKLKHGNVVNLKEIVTSKGVDPTKSKGNIFMVFEYMDHDLTGLSERTNFRLTTAQVKCYMKQILEGLHYCHVNNVLHRDIKGSNLLLNNEGVLKLADFGLSRAFSTDNAPLTNKVITLWYRPPELLLGSTNYGPAVDMWSVGCIFAELLTSKPLFAGTTEVEQLSLIFSLLGMPDEANWPGVSELPNYHMMKKDKSYRRRLRDHLKIVDRHAFDLLEKMLTLDPSKRISAEKALDSEYFWSDPLPADKSTMPKFEPSHELDMKRKRQHEKEMAAKRSRNGAPMGGPPSIPKPRHNPNPYGKGLLPPPPRAQFLGNGTQQRYHGSTGQRFEGSGRGGVVPPWGGKGSRSPRNQGGHGGNQRREQRGYEDLGYSFPNSGYVDIDAPQQDL